MPHVQASIDGHVQRIPHSMTARPGQRRHLGIDFGEFGLGECAAGRPSRGIVGEQQLDLFQREPGGFAQPDHVESSENCAVVGDLFSTSV
jgi:hypothetical protein